MRAAAIALQVHFKLFGVEIRKNQTDFHFYGLNGVINVDINVLRAASVALVGHIIWCMHNYQHNYYNLIAI